MAEWLFSFKIIGHIDHTYRLVCFKITGLITFIHDRLLNSSRTFYLLQVLQSSWTVLFPCSRPLSPAMIKAI